MTSSMIAFCGLVCSQCPAYLATQRNDESLARQTAKEWSATYGLNVTVEDVWCDGCTVGGRKCAHCGECEIRACGTAKQVLNCGHCPDYPCDKLNAFFKMVPMAKQTLDGVRRP
jgi:hypothetical protein